MGDNDRVVYRVFPAMIVAVLVPLVVVGALLLLALFLNDAPPEVLVGVGVGWLLIVALGLSSVVRPQTVLSHAGIAVRRSFGGHLHLWAEITDIQIEEVSSPSSKFKVYGAVVYDTEQRRVALPYFHDKRLGPEQLEGEVDRLRRRWEAERGAD